MVEEEEKKEVKKKDIWFYLFIIGVWVVVVIAIVYLFVIFSQLETLKSNPCLVCQEEFGQLCTDMPAYVTDQFNYLENLSLEGLKG